MNIKFDHTNHKKLWNWLAENPDKEKSDWPEWKENGWEIKRAVSLCFACDYVKHNCLLCYECPLIWPENKNSTRNCYDANSGLFNKYFYSRDLKERSKYAFQIANLPVKDGVETI